MIAIVAAALMAAPPLAAQGQPVAVEAASPEPSRASAEGEMVPGDQLDRSLSFLPPLKPDSLAEVAALKAAKRTANLAYTLVVSPEGKVLSADVVTGSGVAALDEAVRGLLLAAKPTRPMLGGKPVTAQIRANLTLGHDSAKVAGEEPELSDEMKRLGHHGPVVVKGAIQPDGSLGDLTIAKSSQSELVDAAALESARTFRFEPPADATGAYFARPVALEFAMSQADKGQGIVLGLPKYECEAFLREYDWWRSVNPDKGPKDYRLRQIMAGLTVMLGMNRSDGGKSMLDAVRGMDAAWDGATELCRAKPAMLFVDAFKKAR